MESTPKRRKVQRLEWSRLDSQFDKQYHSQFAGNPQQNEVSTDENLFGRIYPNSIEVVPSRDDSSLQEQSLPVGDLSYDADREESEDFNSQDIFSEQDVNDATQMPHANSKQVCTDFSNRDNLDNSSHIQQPRCHSSIPGASASDPPATKADFSNLLSSFNQFVNEYRIDKKRIFDTLEGLVGSNTAHSQSIVDPDFRASVSNQNPRLNPVFDTARVFCSVDYNGELHELKLPRSTALRLEAKTTKRGICKDILFFLHSDPGYFSSRTVHGKSKKKSTSDSTSSDESLPLPALTVKFCIKAVNILMPLKQSDFNGVDVVKREQDRYDADTLSAIGRAISDLRPKLKKVSSGTPSDSETATANSPSVNAAPSTPNVSASK